VFSHCKPLINQDSCSWPNDKTYDTQSFVGWKCHSRAAPSCDIFNLGSSYFHVPLTMVRRLLNVRVRRSVTRHWRSIGSWRSTKCRVWKRLCVCSNNNTASSRRRRHQLLARSVVCVGALLNSYCKPLLCAMLCSGCLELTTAKLSLIVTLLLRLSLGWRHSSSPGLSLFPFLSSASEVTILWRCANTFIIFIMVVKIPGVKK